MKIIDWIFNVPIRLYVKIFLLISIILMLLTLFYEKYTVSLVVLLIAIAHTTILIIAFGFHIRARILINNDLDKFNLIVTCNNVNPRDDIISLIAHYPSYIPEDIETTDPNSRIVFEAIKKIPFIYCIADTIHSYNYYRYDWLKAEKLTFDESFSKLRIGDQIFYHNNRSLIGFCIRLFTRCYWEHVAIYSGNGSIIEATRSGVIESHLNDWINCKDIEIAVLRLETKADMSESVLESIKSKLGCKYNYTGVLKRFWIILTGKLCDGLMTPLIFLTNIVLGIGVISFSLIAPNFPRLGIVFLTASSLYMFDCIYHWLAYSHKLKILLEKINEKS